MPEGVSLARERHRSGLVLTPPASVRSASRHKPVSSPEAAVKSWLRGTEVDGAPREDAPSSRGPTYDPAGLYIPSVDLLGSSLGPETGGGMGGNSAGKGGPLSPPDASGRYDRREPHPRGESETGAYPCFLHTPLPTPPVSTAPYDAMGHVPSWSRIEGKSQVHLPQMPPLRGGICMRAE